MNYKRHICFARTYDRTPGEILKRPYLQHDLKCEKTIFFQSVLIPELNQTERQNWDFLKVDAIL